MKRGNIIVGAGLAAACLTLVSCEDKELAAKISAQKLRISELDAEIDTQKHLLGTKPSGDPVAELKAAEQTLAETQKEVRELELKIEELEAERSKVEKDFESYKLKYPVAN